MEMRAVGITRFPCEQYFATIIGRDQCDKSFDDARKFVMETLRGIDQDIYQS